MGGPLYGSVVRDRDGAPYPWDRGTPAAFSMNATAPRCAPPCPRVRKQPSVAAPPATHAGLNGFYTWFGEHHRTAVGLAWLAHMPARKRTALVGAPVYGHA